ncbi:YeeE/YedE thiosulfate transporter family protein [Oceanidesulfovibrio marinus]|uniref:YeeE/YedE family protein n=1 Tax=Oceanidesulfovibrio marinus TaxID=370038 RepID=A0ABX6NGF6_9BACT|nr:YeeE/YedE thiosulfate transporter family protein [Oceanidesulfovibrio marinus]QJT09128.1 YeeE/YedE family protein [Oceanidesulfovibrio marinus]
MQLDIQLFWGLITGILFGVLLERSRVARYDKQLLALRLMDMTIVKFMLTTIVVAAVGIYALVAAGAVTLSIKPAILGANIAGGLIFGLGWGLVGYCPGTAAAAFGEGRLDALWAMAGMVLGGALYAEAYPAMQATVLTWGDYGKITIPTALGVSPWLVIAVLVVCAALLFRFFERRGL